MNVVFYAVGSVALVVLGACAGHWMRARQDTRKYIRDPMLVPAGTAIATANPSLQTIQRATIHDPFALAQVAINKCAPTAPEKLFRSTPQQSDPFAIGSVAVKTRSTPFISIAKCDSDVKQPSVANDAKIVGDVEASIDYNLPQDIRARQVTQCIRKERERVAKWRPSVQSKPLITQIDRQQVQMPQYWMQVLKPLAEERDLRINSVYKMTWTTRNTLDVFVEWIAPNGDFLLKPVRFVVKENTNDVEALYLSHLPSRAQAPAQR
jgi:hypothetical protein